MNRFKWITKLIFFSAYIQYWAKKISEIENEERLQLDDLKKQLETSKILQASEHIPLVAKLYKEQAKKAEEEAKHQLKEVLQNLTEKIETLENLKRENKQILDSVRYVNVLPEFVKKLKEFIELTQNYSTDREQFLEALDNIEEFRQKLLQQVRYY